jgi:hypothetical protein
MNNITAAAAVAQIHSQPYPYRQIPHGLARNVYLTEGVHRLREALDCYWLIDKIATLQLEKPMAKMPLQFWTLKVLSKPSTAPEYLHAANLVCERDEGDPVYSERISHTNFPDDGISIWVAQDGDRRVIYLPVEH